ncbi:MAG: acyl-CoA thioesterase [Acidimicrobiia bacterium]
MSFRHTFRVRYVDCDAQRVMHNANYLAYIDDAIDTWLRTSLGDFDGLDDVFDLMLKKATVEWYSPARLGDEVSCECRVTRWGSSSFDVEILGSVGDRAVFAAQLVQVSTVPGEARSTPVPERVRSALA